MNVQHINMHAFTFKTHDTYSIKVSILQKIHLIPNIDNTLHIFSVKCQQFHFAQNDHSLVIS